MLAQTSPPFDSPEFLFEIKWDGTRSLAFVDADRLRLQNRRDIETRARYPELECLRRLPAGTVVDSEIVVLEGGKPSFNKLQQREHLLDPTRIALLRRRLPATMIAFDLLYLRGASLMARPLAERRDRLREVITRLGDPHVIASDFVLEHGCQFFAAAEAHALEGIMAKRLGSPYLPGKRSPHWLKIKVAQTAEFEIIGYTQRENEPTISALVIGEREGRRWAYKGKVGSGFTEEDRAALFAKVSAAPPLQRPPTNGPKEAIYRASGLRCLVRFFEKTGIGMLRAPVFKALTRAGPPDASAPE